MAGPRPRTNRAGSGEPSGSARWLAAREKHIRQVNAVSFLNPSRPKRSATTVPEPLRYAEHLPASRIVRILLAVAVPAYIGLQLWEGSTLGAAIGIAILLLAMIFIVSTLRLSVSNHGISFDIAGLRQVSSFGFVPLYAIRDARVGHPADEWPRASMKGGWWPGRSRVSVWYVDENATSTTKAFSVWVSDVERFGTALLGRPMSDLD